MPPHQQQQQQQSFNSQYKVISIRLVRRLSSSKLTIKTNVCIVLSIHTYMTVYTGLSFVVFSCIHFYILFCIFLVFSFCFFALSFSLPYELWSLFTCRALSSYVSSHYSLLSSSVRILISCASFSYSFISTSSSSSSFSSLFVVNNFTSLFTSSSSTLLLFFLASFSRPDYCTIVGCRSHIPLQNSASVCRACKFHCRSHFIRMYRWSSMRC